PEGRLTYLNPAGRAMIGLSEDCSLENTRVLDYYPASERLFASNVILRSMAERGRWTGETSLRHWKTEQSITVFDEHFMVRDKATGQIVGLGSIARDVSAVRRSQEQIRESGERLEMAVRGADLAVWDWNIKTGEALFSPSWAEMRGYRPEDVKPHVD